MEKPVATLDRGTTCSGWNYCGQRLAAGSVDGYLSVFDSRDPSSSSFTSSSKFKVHEVGIVKVVWIPPEYGDAVACISQDGTLSIWEELVEGTQPLEWKLCKSFKTCSKVLDVQFSVNQTSLKMVAAYSDGFVKVFELLDPLELKSWQLQVINDSIRRFPNPNHQSCRAEFQNAIDSVSILGKASCLTSCISWNPQKGEGQESSFILGFNSNTPQLNSPKIWEFDPAHQRWLPVAELALPADKGDQVYSVAWAPNIGRPCEVIATASPIGISIWHVGSTPDLDGRLSIERVALLSGHNSEEEVNIGIRDMKNKSLTYELKVWQMEWDMSGMTLATTGSDGRIRLWQSNLNGTWHEQAAFEPTSS